MGEWQLRNGNKGRVIGMETDWETAQKVRKERNKFLWGKKKGGEGGLKRLMRVKGCGEDCCRSMED